MALKGELHSKMIFKGVKDEDKTKTSPFFIFHLGVLSKRYMPQDKIVVLIGHSCGGKEQVWL